MVNGYTNNYQQVQPQAYQNAPTQAQAMPATVNPSAVSINIISPTVYGPQGQAPVPYVPIYSYPQAQTPPPPPVQATANATATATVNAAPAPAPAPAPVTPPKTVKKNVVPLTNEYIKTLENYINSPNEQTRVMGVKQVMSRFKDDESRKRDAALTALLNKSLQDKNQDVRFLAMTTVASGYAAGDDKTLDLLNRLQQEKSNYNEDALLASQALGKMAEQANAQKVEIPEN